MTSFFVPDDRPSTEAGWIVRSLLREDGEKLGTLRRLRNSKAVDAVMYQALIVAARRSCRLAASVDIERRLADWIRAGGVQVDKETDLGALARTISGSSREENVRISSRKVLFLLLSRAVRVAHGPFFDDFADQLIATAESRVERLLRSRAESLGRFRLRRDTGRRVEVGASTIYRQSSSAGKALRAILLYSVDDMSSAPDEDIYLIVAEVFSYAVRDMLAGHPDEVDGFARRVVRFNPSLDASAEDVAMLVTSKMAGMDSSVHLDPTTKLQGEVAVILRVAEEAGKLVCELNDWIADAEHAVRGQGHLLANDVSPEEAQ